ncbi:hypothetical protein COCCADRAFT_9557 [Bipolaris zeicola 26-R-13]|uniref:Uncharacterized protein n=1 Tax=Cochliobolus carbonum (strain 26-R-13) TaxID=930089 RepID=W6Y9Y2_COCC2|nr:uncharacterized protein COCCADRAFT_9557 [Bipolaris zeicola 26-R-13]EUC27976.1 hypothetical protein COCCADRAFT_9557 [Bipolaris zeicola 26-R-13]
MHLLRFFSVAAVTASMALALPAEIPQVATSELQIVPAAEALANLPPADDVFVRNTPGDVSTKSSSYESESKALAICASPTRKNIFTITLRSTRAIFNGAINWAIKAYLDSQNGPSAFHMTPLESHY